MDFYWSIGITGITFEQQTIVVCHHNPVTSSLQGTHPEILTPAIRPYPNYTCTCPEHKVVLQRCGRGFCIQTNIAPSSSYTQSAFTSLQQGFITAHMDVVLRPDLCAVHIYPISSHCKWH